MFLPRIDISGKIQSLTIEPGNVGATERQTLAKEPETHETQGPREPNPSQRTRDPGTHKVIHWPENQETQGPSRGKQLEGALRLALTRTTYWSEHRQAKSTGQRVSA